MIDFVTGIYHEIKTTIITTNLNLHYGVLDCGITLCHSISPTIETVPVPTVTRPQKPRPRLPSTSSTSKQTIQIIKILLQQ